MNNSFYAYLLLVVCILPSKNLCADAIDEIKALRNSSYYVNVEGDKTLSLRENAPLTPASTMKIVTALLALEKWGGEYKYKTSFYTEDGYLIIVGSGDPFLTSEEIQRIAKNLAVVLPEKLEGIVLDTTLFPQEIGINGRTATANPYDAAPAALAANFNTVSLAIDKQGNITSAEPQTPLTSVSKQMGKSLKGKNDRVSIHSQKLAATHFSEILKHYLSLEGVRIKPDIRWDGIQNHATKIYEHRNSKPLNEVISAMFRYSNNFISNQLFLLLPNKTPVDMNSSQEYLKEQLYQAVNYENLKIVEGSGLSRKNMISTKQFVDILVKFQKYSKLLDDKAGVIRYKTGTLNGVRTLAGYIRKTSASRWYPFAVFINDKAPHSLRFRVAEALRQNLP